METGLQEKFFIDYEEKLKKLYDNVTNFKQEIHRIYVELGNILQKEIDSELKNASSGFMDILLLVDYDEEQNEDDKNKEDEEDSKLGILQLLKVNERKLDEITNPIREKKGKQGESFSKSLYYLAEINKMLNSVDVVQDFASEMEILSFNSIIIATKAGARGSGFKSISGYINKLSRDTNQKFQELRSVSEEVLSKYDNYNFLIINTRNLRIERSHLLRSKSLEFFRKSETQTMKIADSLNEVIENINNTKSDMFSIIIEMQNEDIINQVLSNLLNQIEIILNILPEIREHRKSGLNIPGEEIMSDEEIMKNNLLFVSEIDKFLIDKLERVENNLRKLLNILKDNLTNFHNTVSTCYDSLNAVSSKLEYEEDSEFVDNFLYRSTDLIKEYQYLVTQLISFQNEINTSGKEFIINLNEVDKIYKKLEDIIERMKSVNVLVKIELVREKIEMDAKTNTGDVMEKMLIKIADYLNNLIKQFRETKDKLGDLMDNMSSSVVQQKNKYLATNKILQDFMEYFMEKSNKCHEGIFKAIPPLKAVLFNVDKYIEKVKREIDKLSSLINEQNLEIRELSQNVKYVNDKLKNEYGIDNPGIDSVTDKKLLDTLMEIEKRQNKASLNKYLEEDFNFEGNDDFVVF